MQDPGNGDPAQVREKGEPRSGLPSSAGAGGGARGPSRHPAPAPTHLLEGAAVLGEAPQLALQVDDAGLPPHHLDASFSKKGPSKTPQLVLGPLLNVGYTDNNIIMIVINSLRKHSID